MLIYKQIKHMQDLMASLANEAAALEVKTNNVNESLIEVNELKRLCYKYPDLVTFNIDDEGKSDMTPAARQPRTLYVNMYDDGKICSQFSRAECERYVEVDNPGCFGVEFREVMK